MKLINIFRRSKYKNFLKRLTARLVGSYKVDIKDKHFFVKYSSFWEDVNNGNWEPETFLIFDKYLDKEHSFIDIGAWIGPTVLYGCQIAKKCYAIEPDPVALNILNKNIELNPGLGNKINVFDFCINYESGETKLGNKNSFGNSMSSMLIDDETAISVKCLTLQEFIKQNSISDCNFIKIDVEGAEFNILPYWKEFLNENKLPIHLSLHPSLFRNNMKNYAKTIFSSINSYKNIFDHDGISLSREKDFIDFLSKEIKGADIVATDRSWNN